MDSAQVRRIRFDPPHRARPYEIAEKLGCVCHAVIFGRVCGQPAWWTIDTSGGIAICRLHARAAEKEGCLTVPASVFDLSREEVALGN